MLFAALGAMGGAHAGHVGAGHHFGAATHAHGGGTHAHGVAGRSPGPHVRAGRGLNAGAHAVGATGSGWASTLGGWILSWVSPLTVAAAALWFGGVGLITEEPLGAVALVVAILAAIAGAFIVRAVVGVLIRAGTPPLELTSEGALATVNATIRPDAAGEVIYTLEGLTRSAPARSLDGLTIPRGASVAIVRREAGMAWVAPIDLQSESGWSDDFDAQIAAPTKEGR